MAAINNQKAVIFGCSKTYTHAEGLSCVFRQMNAESHCKYLHGYAIKVQIEFETQHLDPNNWVVDFGGMKEIKQWLKDTFDHKTLVAKDDPAINFFRDMAKEYAEGKKLIQLVEVDAVGMEAFAFMIYNHVNDWLCKTDSIDPGGRVILKKVTVSEHDGNNASVRSPGR